VNLEGDRKNLQKQLKSENTKELSFQAAQNTPENTKEIAFSQKTHPPPPLRVEKKWSAQTFESAGSACEISHRMDRYQGPYVDPDQRHSQLTRLIWVTGKWQRWRFLRCHRNHRIRCSVRRLRL
jgi:hypothetical protein